MSKKSLLALLTLLTFAVPMYAGATWQDSQSRAIGDSVRSSSGSSSEYILTDADQRVVNRAVSRVEIAIKARGESYRAKVVQQLRNSAKKYPNSPRMAAIISATADGVGSSMQPPVQTAKTGWSCGQNVSYGNFSYSTKLMPTGDCWTTVNMKHLPSIGDSWNYGDLTPNLPTNSTGSTYGRLYTWQSAMGLSGFETVKDPTSTTKDVCGMIGDNWSIPSDAQWSSLEKAGATGWNGNKAFWVMSKLPGTYYYNDNKPIPSDDIDYTGEWWSSTPATQYDAYVRYAVSGYAKIDRFYMTDHSGLSVVCVNSKKMSSTVEKTPTVVQKSETLNNVSGKTGTWTVAAGWDCSTVNNSKWSDGDTSVCTDNRDYKMQGDATHDRNYELIKIGGHWWFNQNLAYPLPTGYQGHGTWHDKNTNHYSCPGPLEGDREKMRADWSELTAGSPLDLYATIPDCSQVAKKGYLYQWPAVMAWAKATDSQSRRTQGICPSGWALPTKFDFSTKSSAFWPDEKGKYDGENIDVVFQYGGNTTGWKASYAGSRIIYDFGFHYFGSKELLWSSSLNKLGNPVAEQFESSSVNQSRREGVGEDLFGSVRCIKN